MTPVWWKALAALALAALTFDQPRRWIESAFRSSSRAMFVSVFAASRLGVCALAFAGLGFSLPSDVRVYYSAFGESALVAGRHASSPYSPGFDYLLAGLRWGAPHLLSIVVLMIVAEIAALVLVLRILDHHRPALSRSIAVLWLISPVSLLHVALGGQDEALILLAWAAVASLAIRGRAVAAGAAMAVGLAFTKLLGLSAALPLIGQPIRRTWPALAAATTLGALIVVACLSLNVPFGNLFSEARFMTAGNLWALPGIAFGWGHPEPAVALVILAGLTVAVALGYMHWYPWTTTIGQMFRVSGTVGAVFLLVSQKSLANYLVIFLPGVLFLALQASTPVRVFLLAVALPVSAFEPGLWYYFDEGRALVGSFGARAAMFTTDLTLLLGYGALAYLGLRPRADLPNALEA